MTGNDTARDAGIDRPALRRERADAEPVVYAIWPERPVSIGREPTNAISIDSPFVSKAHAVFRYQDGHYVIEDLGSANGTRLNGIPVSCAEVNVGDVIEIGDERFVFFDRATADTKIVRTGLGKNAKLALAAGGTLVFCLGLFALLLSGTQSTPTSQAPASVPAATPSRLAAELPRTDVDAPIVREVLARAQSSGVSPADALIDEAGVQYRVGRLRDAANLFAAAVAQDPKSGLTRGRLQKTLEELGAEIDAQAANAERAFSQLRFDEATAAWDRVLLLTDQRDPRHQKAQDGLAKARARQ